MSDATHGPAPTHGPLTSAAGASATGAAPATGATNRGRSALEAGLLACHECGQLARAAPLPAGHAAFCPRCDGRLHARKPASLARTWALLIAAYILYVPAMLLPVSTIVELGSADTENIMGGVITLFAGGDVVVGLLLFTASIVVPLLKLLVLSWMALSVQRRWAWRRRDRTVIFRLTEVIGRWSMLDIFVISLLVALVQLDALASVLPEPGAVCFAAVVVLTLFAAESFDSRLIWDDLEPPS